ncbi:hypothetical protein ACJJTC_013971 [Scirpophaga incertulas]
MAHACVVIKEGSKLLMWGGQLCHDEQYFKRTLSGGAQCTSTAPWGRGPSNVLRPMGGLRGAFEFQCLACSAYALCEIMALCNAISAITMSSGLHLPTPTINHENLITKL